jgi:hypothetical protein
VSLTERGLRDTLYDIRRLLAFADDYTDCADHKGLNLIIS